MFDYFMACTWQERDAIAAELVTMYNYALQEEQRLFADLMRNKRSTNARIAYLEAVQRLGTIQGLFETLHIPFDYGQPLAEGRPSV